MRSSEVTPRSLYVRRREFLKLGDSPGSKAKPNPGCAVHRIEVFSG